LQPFSFSVFSAASIGRGVDRLGLRLLDTLYCRDQGFPLKPRRN
jgi:hypothetical protein